MLHTVEQVLQTGIARCAHTGFILPDEIGGLVAMPETGFYDSKIHWVMRGLLQITYTQTVVINHLSLISTVLSSQDIQKCTLSGSITGNEPHLLPLCHTEINISKEGLVTHTSRQILYLQIRNTTHTT